jgi:rubrerythrin
MSGLVSGEISTLAEFLAHALELEMESADRYRELADAMEVHNNPEVAALFRHLAAEGDLHAEQVKQMGADYELPKIAPWDFKWSSPEGPESVAFSDTNYLMSRRQALELALHNETRGRDFYSQVAERSSKGEVKRLADEMAAEETTHVEMLREMLAMEEGSVQEHAEDLDPQHTGIGVIVITVMNTELSRFWRCLMTNNNTNKEPYGTIGLPDNYNTLSAFLDSNQGGCNQGGRVAEM